MLGLPYEHVLAALDSESLVNEVSMESVVEELKRCLEVMIGAKPDAPVDVSQQVNVEAKVQARRERVQAAGAQLMSVAFGFLSELLKAPEPSPQIETLAGQMRDQFAACTATAEDGKTQLTVTLPDTAELDCLATALASVMASAKSRGATTMPVEEASSSTGTSSPGSIPGNSIYNKKCSFWPWSKPLRINSEGSNCCQSRASCRPLRLCRLMLLEVGWQPYGRRP